MGLHHELLKECILRAINVISGVYILNHSNPKKHGDAAKLYKRDWASALLAGQ